MKLSSAIKKSRRQLIYGWSIAIGSFFVLLVGLAKSFYIEGESNTTILRSLYQNINQYIAAAYNEIPLMPFVWDIAPVLYMPPNFSLRENIPFIALVALFVIGCTARDSGHRLGRRIRRARERAEEKSWGRAAEREGGEFSALSLELRLESEDRWYTRPIGILALTILGGYAVNLLSKLTGLM